MFKDADQNRESNQ